MHCCFPAVQLFLCWKPEPGDAWVWLEQVAKRCTEQFRFPESSSILRIVHHVEDAPPQFSFVVMDNSNLMLVSSYPLQLHFCIEQPAVLRIWSCVVWSTPPALFVVLSWCWTDSHKSLQSMSLRQWRVADRFLLSSLCCCAPWAAPSWVLCRVSQQELVRLAGVCLPCPFF